MQALFISLALKMKNKQGFDFVKQKSLLCNKNKNRKTTVLIKHIYNRHLYI